MGSIDLPKHERNIHVNVTIDSDLQLNWAPCCFLWWSQKIKKNYHSFLQILTKFQKPKNG